MHSLYFTFNSIFFIKGKYISIYDLYSLSTATWYITSKHGSLKTVFILQQFSQNQNKLSWVLRLSSFLSQVSKFSSQASWWICHLRSSWAKIHIDIHHLEIVKIQSFVGLAFPLDTSQRPLPSFLAIEISQSC